MYHPKWCGVCDRFTQISGSHFKTKKKIQRKKTRKELEYQSYSRDRFKINFRLRLPKQHSLGMTYPAVQLFLCIPPCTQGGFLLDLSSAAPFAHNSYDFRSREVPSAWNIRDRLWRWSTSTSRTGPTEICRSILTNYRFIALLQ